MNRIFERLCPFLLIFCIVLGFTHANATVWPIGKTTNPDKMTSDHGPRVTQKGPGFHFGIDMRAAVSTPVHAIKGGQIKEILIGNGTSLNYIELAGIRYLHLSKSAGNWELRTSDDNINYFVFKNASGKTVEVYSYDGIGDKFKRNGVDEPVATVGIIPEGKLFAYSGISGTNEAHLHIDKQQPGPNPLRDLPYSGSASKIDFIELSPNKDQVYGKVKIKTQVTSCQRQGDACTGTSIPDLNEVQISVDGETVYTPRFDPQNSDAYKSKIHLTFFPLEWKNGIYPAGIGKELFVGIKDFNNRKRCGGETGQKTITITAIDLKGETTTDSITVEAMPDPDTPPCDPPDDNYSPSIFNFISSAAGEYDAPDGGDDINEITNKIPIAILKRGHYVDFEEITTIFNEHVIEVGVDFDPIMWKDFPVLVIPSTALHGLDSSEIFKIKLSEYVKNGGTLVTLTQHKGNEFSLLPVPEGENPLNGYGHAEDQGCQYESSYMDTWHQIMSSLNKSKPSINVDGYFTSIPSNASILLRRIKNGQPSVVMYPFGNGKVIATTLYSDFAKGTDQAFTEEIAFIRDILTWAKSASTLPEIRPGNSVNLQILVQNTSSTPATTLRLHLLDPSRNTILTHEITQMVDAGQILEIPFVYSTNSLSSLGIWLVEYELFDDSGNKISNRLESLSGRFAVSNPPSNPAQVAQLSFSVQSDADYYLANSTATFTIIAFNNSDINRTLTAKYDGLNQSIMVPAKSSSSFIYQKTIVPAVTSKRFVVNFYDEAGLYYSGAAKVYRSVMPSFHISNFETNKPIYARGETVFYNSSIKNRTIMAIPADLQITVLDFENKPVFSDILHIEFMPYEVVSIGSQFVIPSDLLLGKYSIRAELKRNTRIHDSATTNFELPESMLEINPILPAILHPDNNDLSFNLRNTGQISINSGLFNIRLSDPDGISLFEKTESFVIGIGESKTISMSVSLPVIKFGNYVISYSQSDETKTGSVTHISVPNTVALTLTNDKLSYKVRETANITVGLANTGTFKLESTPLTLSMTDADYAETKILSMAPGEGTQFTFALPLPLDIAKGQHDIKTELLLPSGSTYTQVIKLTVPESSLDIKYAGSDIVSAGEITSLLLENIGGVDTDYETVELFLKDSKGTKLYEGSLSGSIMAGEQKALVAITIPTQSMEGIASLVTTIRESKTGKTYHFEKALNISGISAALNARTEKNVYLKTETIRSLIDLTNASSNIEAGNLKVTVGQPKQIGTFKHFLPIEVKWPLRSPMGITVGSDGSIYVVSRDDRSIHHYHNNGSSIARWGGNGGGAGQFYSPDGIASGSDGSIYVVDNDFWNPRVQKFDAHGTFIRQWGGKCQVDTNNDGIPDQACNGLFYGPTGITVGNDGNIYVADAGNHRIQKFDANGNFIAQWGSYGTANGKFNRPGGLSIDRDGYVYVVDQYNHRIQKFDSVGNFVSKWGSYGTANGQFRTPRDIVIGSDKSVYVTDYTNNRIQKFDSNGIFVSKWGSSGSGNGQFSGPTYIDISSDNYLYVTDFSNNRVQKFSQEGTFVTHWGSGTENGQFRFPQGIALGQDGTIYVSDSSRVQKFDSTGYFSAQWGSFGTGDGQFRTAAGIAVGSNGYVYVVDYYNCRIQKFDKYGNFVSKWGSCGNGDGQFKYPSGIAVSHDGFIYVTDGYSYSYDTHRVQKFDSNGNFVSKWGSYGSGTGQFNVPRGIAVDSDGSVYVADFNNRRIQKFDSNGIFLKTFGSTANLSLGWPTSVSIGPEGMIYVSATYSKIAKYDSNGEYVSSWSAYGDKNGEFNYPEDLEVDSQGNVYVIDSFNHRVQMMSTIGGLNTIYETHIPITQAANTSQQYSSNLGVLNTTGKFYLEGVLTNSIGQVIGRSVSPFYIIQGDAVVFLTTDKKIYSPGETINITGEVMNYAPTSLDNAVFMLNSGDNTILNQTINVGPGGSYPFITTVIATSLGTAAINGKLTQNNVVLSEISEQYEIVNPSVAVSIIAPDITGKEFFDLNLELKNDGKVDANIQLFVSGGQLSETQQLTIPAGESRLFTYPQSITQTTTYTVNIAGALTKNVLKQVVYGESLQIGHNISSINESGRLSFPLNLTNDGSIDEVIDIAFRLTQAGSTLNQLTRTYYLPKGSSLTDNLSYDLGKGEYVLYAESLQPPVLIQVPFKTLNRDEVSLNISTGPQLAGSIPVDVTLVNEGYNHVSGKLILDAGFWKGESFIELNSSQTLVKSFSINPEAAVSGTHQLKAAFYNNSGQEIGNSAQELTIKGAEFLLTSVPGYINFEGGQDGNLQFVIKNSGNQEGKASFALRVMDVLDQAIEEWLKPGEEKTLNFSFVLPDDLEEKDYFGEYELNGQKGQVRFHVSGINIAVNANLDKPDYVEGETAVFTLNIVDKRPVQFDPRTRTVIQPPPINLFARLNYGGYEEQREFSLSGNINLTFSIPLTKITGEKLFYGIYHGEGRSVHLNSLHVYKSGSVVLLRTDKQVYDPGETVNITLKGSGNGELKLSGPGNYYEKLIFNGSDSMTSFVLPRFMSAGTYFIKYQLSLDGAEIAAGNYPIDIKGTQVKTKAATIDKTKYASLDPINWSLSIESNKDFDAVLKTWVLTPEGRFIPAGEHGIQLSSIGLTFINGTARLNTSSSGIHRLVYGIFYGDSLLSSGSETFDVGDSAILGLSTDKVEYSLGNEDVSLTIRLYGTVSAALELYVDDQLVKTEPVNLGGFTNHTLHLGVVSPGIHNVKAVLKSGSLVSAKETMFVYGSNLSDLVVSIVPGSEITIDNKKDITLIAFNKGKTASMPVSMILYDGESGKANPFKTFSVNGLAPGESSSFVYQYDLLGKAGDRTLYAQIDSLGEAYEFNEKNNESSALLNIPTLTFYTETEADEFYTGDELNINSVVTNLSGSMMGASLSTEITDQAGISVFSINSPVSQIAPSANVSVTASWDIPVNTPEGSYTIRQNLKSVDGSTDFGTRTKIIILKPGKDFTLAATQTALKIESGQTAIFGITTESVRGFDEAISLTATGYPEGATVFFTNNGMVPPFESNLKVATSSGVLAGSYTVNVTGIGGAKTHSLDLRLEIADFEMTAVPSSAEIQELGNAEYQIDLSPLNGFESPVHLEVSGLPKGVKASFDKNDVSLPSKIVLKLKTSKWARPGNYEFTVTATGTTAFHKKTLTLVINPNLSIKPGIVTVPGIGPQNKADVKLFTVAGIETASWRALESEYGANVATGDIDGDGFDEIIVGSGPDTNSKAMLKVFKKNGSPLNGAQVWPFNMNYGVNIAVGDIDGDWIEEIVVGTGPDPKGEPRVKVYKYNGLSLFDTGIDIYPYKSEGYKYGANVALADVDGDGLPEILTAPGPDTSASATVKAFKVNFDTIPDNWKVAGQSLEFTVQFSNKDGYGANMCAGDLDGDGIKEIIVASGPSPTNDAMVIKVYRADGTIKGESFNAYEGYKYGAFVACGDLDLDGKDEIVTGAGSDPKNKSLIRMFRGDGVFLGEFFAYPDTIKYGVKPSVGRIGFQ